MARKWCINGRFLTQPVTGVQRYALEIVRALDEHLADGHKLSRGLALEIVCPAGGYALSELRTIRVRSAGTMAGHTWEQAILPGLAHTGLISLCNTGPLLVRKHLVCIHDANTRDCPESYSLAFRTLYRGLHPALGRRAAKVATVSRYSAGQLVRHGIRTREKIVVAPDGHEHALRWIASHSPATRAVAGPNTVVIIASAAPHKNVGLILGMAERIAEAGLRVAVVGSHDRRVLNGQQPEVATANISWMGRLTDGELVAMLQDFRSVSPFPRWRRGSACQRSRPWPWVARSWFRIAQACLRSAATPLSMRLRSKEMPGLLPSCVSAMTLGCVLSWWLAAGCGPRTTAGCERPSCTSKRWRAWMDWMFPPGPMHPP